MSGKRSFGKEEESGRGRHRGRSLNEEEQAREDSAKGHGRVHEGKPGLIGQPDPQEAREERGHQTGYGKNQETEGQDRQYFGHRGQPPRER